MRNNGGLTMRRANRPLPFDSPSIVDHADCCHNVFMALSARNQFAGKVVSVRHGAVMSEVVIDIGGGHQIVSLISTSSAKRLRLEKGPPGRLGHQGNGSDYLDGRIRCRRNVMP